MPKSVYAMNDLYPNSNATITTSGETIPETIEREHYQDNTTERADGKTEVVNSKWLFVAIAAFIGVAYLLHKME